MPPTPPPDESASNALVQVNTQSPYQTTLDLAGAGQLAFNISLSFMRNLSWNRIDTEAFTISQFVVGRSLVWHQKGRERFARALSETENGLVSSVNRFLKFGINATSLRYVLQLEEGQVFAALCASLCECYTVDWTAKIILQLVKKIIRENSDDLQLGQMSTPSLQAISTLADRYCGLFAASDFGVMVEEYMTHDGHDMVTGLCRPRSNSSKIPRTRGISSPEHIADALYEIIQLSRGRSLKVQLVGGADAVAVAAIGVWLVDLPTAFYTAEAESPKLVTSTHGVDQPARVVVLFSEAANDHRSLVQGRTVRLPTITDLLSRNKTLNGGFKVSGKLQWHTALSVAFGRSFTKLIKMESNFGPALGSAARVYQAFVDGDDSVPVEWRAACQTYYKNSSGIDFVHFAFSQFQELATPNMKEGALAWARQKSYSEAESKFETSMFTIADICHCKYCCFNGTPTPKRTAATATNHTEPDGHYCLVALCSTIIRLVRVLSGIDMLGKKMRLNRSGLECFYNQQHDRLVAQRKGARSVEKDEMFLYRIVEHAKVDKLAPEYSPLAVANTLFSGNQMNKNIQPNTSAFAAQGICCYFNILQQKEPREASVISRVCVVPGTIEYHRQTYAGLGDLGSHQYQDASPRKTPRRPDYCVPDKIREHTKSCRSTDLQLVVDEELVDQRNPWLNVGFELLGQEGMISFLGPARIVENVSRGMGIVSCRDSKLCTSNEELAKAITKAMPDYSPEQPWVDLEYGNSRIFVFRGDTPTAFIVAQGCWQPLFLTTRSCVTCAIRTGVGHSWPNFAIVCSPESYIEVCTYARQAVQVN